MKNTPPTAAATGLEAAFVRLDLMLKLAVLQRLNRMPLGTHSGYAPMLSEGDLAEDLGIEHAAGAIAGQIEETLNQLEAQGRPKPGLRTPDPQDSLLAHVQRVFGLDGMGWNVVLACLAPDFHHKYARIYAFLGENPGLNRPDSALLHTILTRTHEQHLRLAAFLHGHPAVTRYGLLQQLTDGRLRVKPRLCAWLAGAQGADPQLAPALTQLPTARATPDPKLPDQVEEAVRQIPGQISHGQSGFTPYRIHLVGASGSGRRQAAGRICAELGLTLFELHPGIRSGDIEDGAVFEMLLSGGVPLVDESTAHLDESQQLRRQALLEDLNRTFPLVFVLNDRNQDVVLAHPRPDAPRVIPIYFPQPDFAARAQAWRHALQAFRLKRLDPDQLGAMYHFTRGRIFEAARAAQTLRLRNPLCDHDTLVIEAARGVSNRKLAQLAERVPAIYTWEQLVLPDKVKRRLEDLVVFYRHRDSLFDDWGFASRVAQKGMHALFHGAPGTGKTMAAGIIANLLNLEMYRIDLSSIISKYIGETEKNLAAVFHEARAANAVLFFDEADALFGKRGEVNNANDRFANVEISYLLQEMEAYDGITILATNLLSHLDEAFIRRIKAIIEFPFPEWEERLQLWHNIFPARVPLKDDIDFRFISEKFRLSGGEIKNAALSAATFAVERCDRVGMVHILWAIREEQEKKGRMFIAADYGNYADLVHDHPLNGKDSSI